MKSKIVLDLPHGKDNPRNSEGSFVTLADGRIMFAYTRYRGESWDDHASADIAARFSSDGGETWTGQDAILVANEGRYNVMSASLLRLADKRLALFYLRKNSAVDCRLWLRVSEDEGRDWSQPTLCIPASGYFVVNNDRVVQLKGGRLLVPANYHRSLKKSPESVEIDGRGVATFFFSDDGGRTWQEAAGRLELPASAQSKNGLQESGVVELKDGKLYAWARTGTGWQWEMDSVDQGRTWSEPRQSRFRSPRSPLSMKRMPKTGDLLAVWNDITPRPGVPDKKMEDGWASDSSWGRTPLAAAVSGDDGRTWGKAKLLEDDPQRGFCYTAIHFLEDSVLLAYCCGGRSGGVLQDLCIRKVALDRLYDR